MRRSTRCLSGIALGLSAALLSLIPYVSLLEEKIGLGLLFALRGEQRPPAEVVIVDIDQESANRLSASGNPEHWPRRLHADLIRRLHEAGAEVIGFNIFFSSPQPQEDDEMAQAMRESGAVALANYVRSKPLPSGIYTESLDEPPAALAQAAWATAPFLLAQGEETDRFLTHYGENTGQPTFPTVLLRLFALRTLGGELDMLLHGNDPKPVEAASRPLPSQAQVFAELDSLLRRQPENRERLLQRLREQALPAQRRTALHSLIETFTDESPRYFNHYGPVGMIPRIPYHHLLMPEEGAAKPDLRGKVVLVGFDENFLSDISEGLFFSPFSAVSSLNLAATAVANLLNHDDIRPLFGRWGQFAWLLCWGSLLGGLSLRSLRVGMTGIMLLSAGYLATACWLFGTQWLWIPVFLPLLWLAPLGMMFCLIGNYLTRSRENRKIHSLISRFIPAEAARQIGDESDGWASKLSFGVCLATDAGQYTALAEKMAPMDLGELMNEYYATLFPPVSRHGGWVSDVTGDAMLAIWTSPDRCEIGIRVGALRAALEILRAVDGFQAKTQVKLPIRMGLHCGEMRVGFVGGSDHGAYRAVGDTVNTSARLEGLNKLLGTHILVSQPLLEGLAGFVTRPIGSFMLAGKTHPVLVHELLAPVEASTPALESMASRFAEALALFQAAQWQDAAEAFGALSDEFPDDGPIRFYTATARFNAVSPLANPDAATISVGKSPPGALA